MEKYLYAPGATDDAGRDPKDDAFEKWLADEIDGPAASVISKITEGASIESLTNDERHALADFLAVLDVRTPKIRDVLVPAFRERLWDTVTDVKDTQLGLRQRGVRRTKGDIARVQRAESNRIVEEFAKPAWLKFIARIRGRARVSLKSFSWSLVHSNRDEQFITNDIGVAKTDGSLARLLPWTPGISEGRIQWIVPLSPAFAMVLARTKVVDEELAVSTLTSRVNQQLISDAHRYVFARSELPTSVFRDPRDAA